MKAGEVNLNRFLKQPDTQFVIPVYQRNYDWKKSQCRQLIDDIISVGSDKKREAHFIGSIVYIHDDVYSSSGLRELVIIDGQQRITTLTLIYLTLYNFAQDVNDEAMSQRIHETYLINKFAQDEEKLKLKPTDNNDKALKYLLRNDSNEPFLEYSQLIENYNYFKTKITSENIDQVRDGLNKLMFVEISLEREKDDPQRIFESLNSTGLDLTQADLIRNYILMGLNRKNQLKIYRNYWQPIEKQATDLKNNTNCVSDFIRDFLTIENRVIPNKGKVYEAFKLRYPIQKFEHIEEALPRIKKFACHYNRFINPDSEPDRKIRQNLKLLNRLEVNVSYPFLLEVYDDYTENVIDQDQLIEVMELVQSFIWRRFVVGLPTNSLNKIFMRLYEDIEKQDYLGSLQRSLLRKKGKQRFPNDQEVLSMLKEKDMYNIQNKNRLYFFERLENYQNYEYVQFEDNPDITIEHIFPQKPNSKWQSDIGEADYQQINERYLNAVANLTLSGNNGSLGNSSFIDKRDMNRDNKEQGYRYSRLWLNKYLASCEKWGVEEIETRFQLIAERFKKIWKYPAISLDGTYVYDEVNIFDAEDPTHKKLTYAIFRDQKLEMKHVSELYVYVMKTLFELNPNQFFATELITKVGITSNLKDLRQASPLDETYFIEVNLDNQSKFERMKLALSVFELEEDLIIKYADD